MSITLRPYQERAVTEVATKLAEGKRKVIFQLATGGGKTVVFSAISQRFTEKNESSVLILVHRKELLQQTRKTLYTHFGIIGEAIVAGVRHIKTARVYVGMVESVSRRIQKINGIGLVIIDEAHIANFNKIHQYFPEQFIIGFTATPLSSNKKMPMKDYYDDIVCGVDIPELIQGGHLCQNITFAPKDIVERSALTLKGGEFDEGAMAAAYSAPRHINNTVKAYEQWGGGTKTIIFNCNIEHSKAVTTAFKLAGYETRHLDGTMNAAERTNTLNWFKHTPTGILNNVAVLTAGFDEPSIETVIINKATMSLPLWLQTTGRGSRPTPSKSMFRIIDMGGNALQHGDWCDSRNWADMFHNPKKPRDSDQPAPVKSCPQCQAIIAAQCITCQYCGYEFPKKEAAPEEELSELVVITRGIDVQQLISENQDKKDYFTFFRIGRDLAANAGRAKRKMTDELAEQILIEYERMAADWCHTTGRRWNQWHRDRAREHLFTELAARFKDWESPVGLPDLTTSPSPSMKERKWRAAPVSSFGNITKLQKLQNIFTRK